MKKLGKVLGLLIISISLINCGKSGIDNDEAATTAGYGALVLSNASNAMTVDPTGTSSSILSQFTGESMDSLMLACTETGDSTDGDSDGIKKSISIDFSTCGISATGTATISDNDDGDPLSGFTMVITDFAFDLGDAGSISMDLSATMTKSGSTYSLAYSFSIDFNAQGVSGDLSTSMTITYTPTNGSSPYDGGTFNITGTFSADVSGNGNSIKVDELSLTATDLAYTSTGCSGSEGFNSGSASITDGKNTIVITYDSSCNTSSTYNGTSIATN